MTRPTWLTRLIGPGIALVVLVFLVLFIQTPIEVVKLIGTPLQILPTLVGITPFIPPQEILTIDLHTGPVVVTISRPGNYAIYSDDQQILMRTGMIETALGAASGNTWVKIRSVERGEDAPGAYVARGASLWDTLAVRGRPLMTFVIAEPGQYEILYPPQSGTVSFAPDYTTGREAIILLAWAAQIAVIALIVALLLLPHIRRRRQAQRQVAAKLDRKRAAAEAFWEDKLRNSQTRE